MPTAATPRPERAARHARPPGPADWTSLELVSAAELPADDVLSRLGSSLSGLSHAEVGVRMTRIGPNALRSHGARPLAVLMRQLHNPMLVLLVAAALTSFVVGERTSALIILAIICMSVGLGFFNEYRSELAVEALHSQLRHSALAVRGGKPTAVYVTELVPGDTAPSTTSSALPASHPSPPPV